MRAAALRLAFFVALCWVIAAGGAGLGAQEADLAGTYQGLAPTADPAKRVYTLTLAADGTADLTTLYIGKNDATEHGRWTRNGRQIVIMFDAMGPNRPPHPLTFRHRGHQLSPIHWDPSEWGRAGPPVFHRAHPAPGGA